MRRSTTATAMVFAMFLLALGQAPATPAEPVRIMLSGDSLTQGFDGDHTWRYRLWGLLAGAGVEFVGPRTDLVDLDTESYGSQAYADPAFDRDHAARWGAAYLLPAFDIESLISEYRPDVVVQTMGVNDLVWLGRDPAAVAADAAEFVRRVQRADPDVDVVLALLPQVWYPQVVTYNDGLRAVASALDSELGRVVIAASDSGITALADTFDKVHLAATGELTFAAAVADALAGLGIGRPAVRPLPKVRNGPRQAATLTVEPGRRRAVVRWTDPPGGSVEYLWMRDLSRSFTWRRSALPLSGSRHVVRGLVPRHVYEIRLQAARGSAVSDVMSATVRVVARRSPGPAATSAGSAATPATAATT